MRICRDTRRNPWPEDPEIDQRSKSDSFQRASAAVLRAIAERAAVTVVYSGRWDVQEPCVTSAGEVHLPAMPEHTTREDIACARGAVDAMGLRLKYHDAELHARHGPSSAAAFAAFEAMEQARVEALGAERFRGVRKNLAAYLERGLSQRGYQAIGTLRYTPMGAALRVMMLDRIGHLELGTTGAHIRSLVEVEFGGQLDRYWDALAHAAHDQILSGSLMRELIETLALQEASGSTRTDDEAAPERAATSRTADPAATKKSAEGEPNMLDARAEPRSESIHTDEPLRGEDADDSRQEPTRAASPNAATARRARPERYKAFTRRFDRVDDAAGLCDAQELLQLRQELDQRLVPF